MRYRNAAILSLGLSALFTAILAAQTEPSVAPAATSTKPAEVVDAGKRAALAEVLKNLGDEDFAVRNAAQKKLASMGNDFAPALREAQAQTADGEIKQRLQQALDGITEYEALNPPKLTFELKDASFTDIAKALSKATDIKIEAAGAGTTPVTLKIENKTFWETITAINAAAALDVKDSAYDRKFVLDPQKAVAGSYKQASLSGAFAFFPGTVDHLLDGYAFNMRCAIDPRIKVLRQSHVTLTEFIDDGGNSLAVKAEENPLYESQGAVFSTVIRLNEPAKPSKKAVSIKGNIRYLVLIEQGVLEVPDLSKPPGPITLGGYSISFKEAKLVDGKPSLTYTTGTPDGKPPTAAGMAANPVFPEFEIRDHDGKFIYRIRLSGGGGGGMKWGGVDKFTEPFQGRLVLPLKTKEVTVPFEFKDLPMP